MEILQRIADFLIVNLPAGVNISVKKEATDLLSEIVVINLQYDSETQVDKEKKITDLYLEIEKEINDIPGIYMLDDTNKQQYIYRLCIATYLPHIKEKSELASNLVDYYNEKSIRAGIISAIDEAADTYVYKENTMNLLNTQGNNHWYFPSILWAPQDEFELIKQLRLTCLNECGSIPGFNNLETTVKNKFLNHLLLLKQRNSTRFSFGFSFKVNGFEEWESRVQKAIDATFIPKIEPKLNEIVTSIDLGDILNQDLCNSLKEELKSALLQQAKAESDKSDTESVNKNVRDICFKLIILKYLGHICYFNQMTRDEQTNILKEIFEKSNQINFRGYLEAKVGDIIKNLSLTYKNILNQLNFKDPEDLSISQNIMNNLNLLAQTPSVQAAVKGSVMGLLVANVLPSVGNEATNDSNLSNAITLKKSFLAASIGALFGYKYSSIMNKIFPLEYVIAEIIDIHDNQEKKSIHDRLIRSLPLVAYGIGLLGITTALISNPLSFPLISSLGLSIMFSVPVIAGCSKLANKFSKKIHDYFGLQIDSEYYTFTDRGKTALGVDEVGIDNIVDLFKSYIKLYEQNLKELPQNNERDIVYLKDIIHTIKQAFCDLRDGKHTNTAAANFKKAIKHMIEYQKNLAVTSLADIRTNELESIIAQLAKDTGTDQLLLAKEKTMYTLNRGSLNRLKEDNVNILGTLDNSMERILDIYKIVDKTIAADASADLVAHQNINNAGGSSLMNQAAITTSTSVMIFSNLYPTAPIEESGSPPISEVRTAATI